MKSGLSHTKLSPLNVPCGPASTVTVLSASAKQKGMDMLQACGSIADAYGRHLDGKYNSPTESRSRVDGDKTHELARSLNRCENPRWSRGCVHQQL